MIEDTEKYLCCSNHEMYLNGIIYTCCNNHNVCLKCYSRNKKCPVCRSLEYKRNTGLEEKITKLVVDCKNIECSYKVLDGDEHRLYCKYKSITCPICQTDIKYSNIIKHLKVHYPVYNTLVVFTDDISKCVREAGIYIINHAQSEEKKIILIVDDDIKILYIDESENPTKTILSLVDRKYNTMIITLPYYNNEITTDIKFTEIDLVVFIEYNFMVIIEAFDNNIFKKNSNCMIRKNNNTYRGLILDHWYNSQIVLVKYEVKIDNYYISVIEELKINPQFIREEYPDNDYTTEEYGFRLQEIERLTRINNPDIIGDAMDELIHNEVMVFLNSIPDRPAPF